MSAIERDACRESGWFLWLRAAAEEPYLRRLYLQSKRLCVRFALMALVFAFATEAALGRCEGDGSEESFSSSS